ncbi:MAG: hypothetical protein QM569_04725, partial [Acidovorax sp.]|uniref:hypothetical protein n=1 Tax=Acidovorax sp. TaxID=1872122 RepID=UPI0039E46B80
LRAPPLLARYQDGARHARATVLARVERAAPMQVLVRDAGARAQTLHHALRALYQAARRPPIGISDTTAVTPGAEPCYTPPAGDAVALVFSAAWTGSTALVFACGGGDAPGAAAVVIPIRKVYSVVNDITIHRVDTGAQLHAHGLSMSLDYQSWSWSWSASLHADAAAHLGRDSAGDPAELAVQVNGIEFRLRLERVAKDRRFLPQVRWAVSGKGLASILGAPYAPDMSFANAQERTAQQLAEEALTINGVSIGWTLDWGIVDWLVPAGAWALQGTYIDAINDIATAAGGYVQPHATDAVLRVLPRYPSAPWEWSGVTPDFEIPGALAEVVATEYVDRPDYDRVYLGGLGAGVFGPFTRSGTAGATLAPQVNHALITHADVHRARGIAELGNTGRQEHYCLRLPVLPELGVIVPGQFVRHMGDTTVMGIVRSTSIEWSRPTLRQTIAVETHAAD